MSDSREESPDWLRSFQAPTHSLLSLSSDSNSSHNVTSSREYRMDWKEPSLGNADHKKVTGEITSGKHVGPNAPKISIWALSSDSESCPDTSLTREEKTANDVVKEENEDAALIDREGKSPLNKVLKEKSPKKGRKVIDQTPKKEKDITNDVKREGNDTDEIGEEETSEKHNKPCASTSTLPLVLSEKVQRSKALVECEGESIDLSGDMGAVGRVVIPDTPNGNREMFLDLKGTIYKTTIVPSRTFCIVSFGQSEAKIEAIMNDFIQLKPQSNVYEAETMVEGTLDGFSFDSEDETDKIAKPTSYQIDQNDGIEEQTNRKKTKAKAEKSSGAGRKRGTTSGGKPQPPKKARKKTQVPKKAKAKK